MTENFYEPQPLNPFLSALLFVLTLFIGFVIIGPIIGFFFALPFYPGSFIELAEAITSSTTNEEIKVPFLILQGSATAFGLVAIPVLVYRLINKMNPVILLGKNSLMVYGLTAAAVVVFMFPNSIIIDWNANLDFSGSFWDWAREREELAETFTKFLTQFNTGGELLAGLFVIAVLPAIGEEFTFRGWLQPLIQRATDNPHLAIWTTAIFFSAFHFQFFGFIPRMLLGAMFGYLMYWSNNLWVPIAAHFVNNGFSVIMVYLHQTGNVEFDAESTDALPIQYVLPLTVLFIFLMFYIKKSLDREAATSRI